jgi:hypothetical protein
MITHEPISLNYKLFARKGLENSATHDVVVAEESGGWQKYHKYKIAIKHNICTISTIKTGLNSVENVVERCVDWLPEDLHIFLLG